jgi:hypothetical protein
MARPKVTGRAGSLAARNRRKQTAVKHKFKTRAEFCRDWNISLSTYDIWKRKGLGPREWQPGGPRGIVWITPEAETAWARQHSGIGRIIENAAAE